VLRARAAGCAGPVFPNLWRAAGTAPTSTGITGKQWLPFPTWFVMTSSGPCRAARTARCPWACGYLLRRVRDSSSRPNRDRSTRIESATKSGLVKRITQEILDGLSLIKCMESVLNRLGLRRGELRPVSHLAVEHDRERLRVEVLEPPVIPRSKLGLERIPHRFLRRVAARREEPDPDRLALPAPEGEVVVIEEWDRRRAPGSD
jgi:hypothetical protein